MRSSAVTSVGLVLEQKLEAFKGYLIFSEETGPLPYRVTAARHVLARVFVLVAIRGVTFLMLFRVALGQ